MGLRLLCWLWYPLFVVGGSQLWERAKLSQSVSSMGGGWIGIQQRLKRDAKAASFPFSRVPHHQSVVIFGEFFHVHVKHGSSELIFCQS